ncbi:putative acid phosphatase [Yarrowia sp. C11]|nr:putative acid phosphatase [Yarrowia sp. E02]KAG5372901.1 putative acid phosphatase [Yarrowia sp. C11]
MQLTLVIAALTSLVTAQSSIDTQALYGNKPTFTKYDPSLETILADAAKAPTSSFAGKKTVPGKAFDKYYQIWLENTDYDKAYEQEDMQWFMTQGITLTNYWAQTHPSSPNYVAVVGGSYFGSYDNSYRLLPESVPTVADLLETKDISWGEYQEDQPFSGFTGYNFSRQSDYADAYMRKHNPLVFFETVTNHPERLANIKNFTEFDKDLAANALPQWAFITPNMTNDAHDTDVEFAGKWARGWLGDLLKNEEFMKNNLIILTFDENDTYAKKNTVVAILLGGAVPEHLKGTSDDTYYNHYSNIATCEANWDLPHLGRGDVDANVFKFVADQLNIPVVDFDTSNQYNNFSAPGFFSDKALGVGRPQLNATGAGGARILPALLEVFADASDVNGTGSAATFFNRAANGTAGNGTVVAPSVSASASPSASASASSTQANGAALVGVSLGAVVIGAMALFA